MGLSALGQIAARTLVTTVWAVEFTVADARQVDTLIRHVGTLPLMGVAFEGWRGTGVSAWVLIRAVTAVVLAIADVRLEDTMGILALEVAWLTVDLAARRRLVRLVVAVRCAIAIPGLGNADTRGGALELLVGVALVWC